MLSVTEINQLKSEKEALIKEINLAIVAIKESIPEGKYPSEYQAGMLLALNAVLEIMNRGTDVNNEK